MDKIAETPHWLQTTLIFQGLSGEQLKNILAVAQLQTLKKGAVIFKQGEPASGFFIVKLGRIKLFKISVAGKEQILRIFESGDNFAEVVALDGKPFPASASTLEATELLFFPRLAVMDLLHQHPDIGINMLISLSRHLRHLTAVIEELSFKDVPQRLATYLLKLTPGDPEHPSNRSQLTNFVTLDVSKSQLAAILGTIPATLSRAFYTLKNEGLIEIRGSQIELLDYDRLQVLSQTLTQSD